MKEPALGVLEFKSVAKGIFVTDVMAKKAPIKILATNPICPGKYMIIIGGEVADVEESMRAGVTAAKDMLVNDLFLPLVHQAIIPAITGTRDIQIFGSIGVIETFSVCSCIIAADIAAKASPVELVEMRLANGLGGKAYFVVTGELADVEISIARAKDYVKEEGMLAASEIIASPHPDLLAKSVYW